MLDKKLIAEQQVLVDGIFSQADVEMQEKIDSACYKDVFKRKKHPIIKSLLIIFIIISIVIYYGASFLITEIKRNYPIIKEQFIESYKTAQNNMINVPDEELTVEEYFSKKIFLLVKYDELEQRINHIEDVVDARNVFEDNNATDTSVLTGEEKEQFDALQKEYDDYIANGGDPNQMYVDAVKNNQLK